MGKTSQMQAIIHAKCPKCRRGDVYSGPMYGLKPQKVNESCPHCGFRFEVEPGYFYAAMYVSYALNVAEIVTSAILTFYLSGGSESPWLYLGVLFAIIFILAPFNFRYSRVILLHWLSPKVKYNPELDR
ncbi:uncharacterized protein DUF983 [Arcticibacter tournemirensis]|uniref:DUF983 domain-containing protein n=1 Tax=Arcticibacter tournemirensis TaxID=699437 RepID=A0A4Q0M3L5_9SPHI|nr:DUF983 domain-containing protein [Arcticibacter tournemirensis]KAA8478924.1 DUF983 domain-containing protein [Arcticibacter tournemirensis]RXF67501.1 DUF983 domain-containing protein [Arcticibacter tournemirensis]TQM49145.1 uncharacterized protein DUF983 [Arcticibacter tournemirensis]